MTACPRRFVSACRKRSAPESQEHRLMQLFSRIVGVLLLAGLAASSAGARAFTLPAAQNTPPAGCHGHALPARAPAPLSHQCCIAGHDHAVPGSVFSGITLLPYCGAAGEVER